MSWDDANKMSDAAGDSSNYLQLKDGDSYKIVLLGEPVSFYKKYDPETKETDYLRRYTQGYTLTFRYNVAVETKEGWELKILEKGNSVHKQFKRYYEKRGDLDKYIFTISREGTGLKTEYPVDYEEKLSDKERKMLQAYDLIDLDPFREREESHDEEVLDEKPKRSRRSKPEPVDEMDDVPF